MTSYFTPVHPFWINAFDVLKESFFTEPRELTLQEVTQSFFLPFTREKTIERYQSL